MVQTEETCSTLCEETKNAPLMGIAESQTSKRKLFTSTAKPKRAKRNQQQDFKKNVPLHQEFMKIIEAAQSAAQTKGNDVSYQSAAQTEGNDISYQTSKHNSNKCFNNTAEVEYKEIVIPEPFQSGFQNLEVGEQLVPSPIAPSVCTIECKSTDSIVPSPYSMEMCAPPTKLSPEYDTQPFFIQASEPSSLTQATVFEQSSPFLDETLPDTELDIDGLMNEFFQKSTETSTISTEAKENSQHCSQHDGNITISTFAMYEEMSESSAGQFNKSTSEGIRTSHVCEAYAKYNMANLSPERSTIAFPADDHTLCENANTKQEDPQSCPTETEAAATPPSSAAGLLQKQDDYEKLQNQPGSSILLNEDPDNKQEAMPGNTCQEIMNKRNPVTAKVQLTDNAAKTIPQQSNSEEFFGELSLSSSQFLDIDAKCQQVREEHAQQSKSALLEPCQSQSKPLPTELNFIAQAAPSMNWTQSLIQSQQRLQSAIQEISRLNAMVIRARRTLWPQQQNLGKSAQQGKLISHQKTPHPQSRKPAEVSLPHAAESYPDWNYS